MAMTASVALLAALGGAAEAFPLDWTPRVYPGFARPEVTVARRATPAQVGQSAQKDDKAAKESAADLASKAKGVLTIVVSTGKQQLTVYSDGVPIARTRVLTGTPGHPTPHGVFSIIQKDKWHRSNIYDDAPMYYMQRITWSGVALHQGVVPDSPASPGCIRLPEAFAKQLWPITKIGVRVIVAQGDVSPSSVTHARLFKRRIEPIEPIEPKPEPGLSSAEVVESAYKALQAKAPSTPAKANIGKPDSALDAMAYAKPNPPASTSADVVRSAYDPFDFSNRRARSLPTGSTAEVRPLRAGPISVFISRREGKLFVRKGFDAIYTAPVTFEQPDRPLGTHVFTAFALNDDDTARWNVITIPNAGGWARKGEQGSGELPSAGSPSTASQALERVHIPPEALDRVSELMSAGASLIISDYGLGPETGTGTDFIVLTR
jgi:lipoprotein-anchoring transpeptidase ErfK/SrfK